MKRELALPIREAEARELSVGDVVHLTGKLYTARDEAHRLMLAAHEEGKPLPFDPAEMVVFHCGPVARQAHGRWSILAAGPTTSARMELFEERFLKAFRPRITIGKGGMGDRTQAALESVGAAYAHYSGGCGALAAKHIRRVEAVHWIGELGIPEAVWILDVYRFGPLLVTMDSRGGNLYRELEATIRSNMEEILARIGRS